MYKKLFLLFALLTFCLLQSQQNTEDSGEKITTALENYFYLEREAIHLHLDKTSFLTNEKIWYQGYIIDRKTKKPFFTTNVFVVLYDDKGTQISEKLVYAYSGVFSGVIPLDPKMHSGNYYIQVYTNWMNNFSEDESTITKINIINTKEGVKNYKKINEQSLEISLHPEGKSYIKDINNIIGIQVKDCRGNAPENLEALVQNAKGETLKTVKLNAFGYGKFETTSGDDCNKVVVTYKDQTLEKQLPNKDNLGFGLEVNNFTFDSKTIVKIKTNSATVDFFKSKKAYLLIHQDSKHFIYDIEINPNALEQTISLNNVDLFSGVNTLRIIDSDLKQWSERLIYISPKKEAPLSVVKNVRKVDKVNFVAYTPYQNTMVSVNVVPVETKALTENYTILAGIAINPYLAEPLQNANYYLNEPKRSKYYELDLFMLNQAVTKYDWQSIKTTKPSTNFSFDIGMTLKGTINPAIKDKTYHKVKLTSFKDQIMRSADVNEKGEYSFENLILTDSTSLTMSLQKLPNFDIIEGKIPYQLLNRKKTFYKPFKPSLSNGCPEIKADDFATSLDFPKFSSKVVQLEEIEIKNETKTKLSYQNQLGNSYLIGYKVDEILQYNDLLSFVERNGFTVVRSFGEATIYSRINNSLNAARPTPQIIIDGRIIMDQSEFTTMRMMDIDEIYLSANALVPGMQNNFGIIKVYRKKNYGANRIKQDPNTFIVTEAFSLYPTFENAEYDNTQSLGFDNYGLIQWTPTITTDDSGQFLFNITDYNKAKVKVIIEGISPDGKLIHEEFIMDM